MARYFRGERDREKSFADEMMKMVKQNRLCTFANVLIKIIRKSYIYNNMRHVCNSAIKMVKMCIFVKFPKYFI